ncbi:MAG: hypothetical protein ACREEC_13980, partial [Thermoplasmata archaeon]
MATVIGALLVVLAFVAVFGLFLTQVVPAWMATNEESWGDSVRASLAQFQSTVDLQTSLGSPASATTPISLTSAGVPVLAAGTEGSLDVLPQHPGFVNVSMSVGPGGVLGYYQNVSGGAISVSLPDRYSSPQTFVFEAGAIIAVGPSGGAAIEFPPQFSVHRTSGNTSVSLSLLDLSGTASGTTGGTQGIVGQMLERTSTSSDGRTGSGSSAMPFELSVRIGSEHACAWYSYLDSTLLVSGLPSG